ncbi:MAG: hypothetical protein KAX78_12870, partial [Phycisphaerae bacterium]|nr:hypothetical protein [Phycisphaerae bacterium]
EFYSLPSAFHRLRVWPLKKNSWLANLAIYRGLRHYYSKRGRTVPRFADNLGPDAAGRIARTLGTTGGR